MSWTDEFPTKSTIRWQTTTGWAWGTVIGAGTVDVTPEPYQVLIVELHKELRDYVGGDPHRFQYTPETCPGRPCGSECDHVGARGPSIFISTIVVGRSAMPEVYAIGTDRILEELP